MFTINFQCLSGGNDITRTENQLGAINLHCFKRIIRNVFWEMRISNFSEESEILLLFIFFKNIHVITFNNYRFIFHMTIIIEHVTRKIII